MRPAGFVLLVSGTVIALAAMVLLANAPRFVFLLAAIAIQGGGLFLVARSHRPAPSKRH